MDTDNNEAEGEIDNGKEGEEKEKDHEDDGQEIKLPTTPKPLLANTSRQNPPQGGPSRFFDSSVQMDRGRVIKIMSRGNCEMAPSNSEQIWSSRMAGAPHMTSYDSQPRFETVDIELRSRKSCTNDKLFNEHNRPFRTYNSRSFSLKFSTPVNVPQKSQFEDPASTLLHPPFHERSILQPTGIPHPSRPPPTKLDVS